MPLAAGGIAMSTITSLILDYATTTAGSCTGALFEVPDGTVYAGDTLTFKLWGNVGLGLFEFMGEWFPESAYVLYHGTTSLGVGTLTTDTDLDDLEEDLDFSQEAYKELSYPCSAMVSAVAGTELVYLDENDTPQVYASRGDDVSALFRISNTSCLATQDGQKIYGTVQLTATRVATYLAWDWTIPSDQEGVLWFFLYKNGTLENAFSLELPALTTTRTYTSCTFKFYDYATETALSDVAVMVDGVAMGTTDANGVLHVPKILTGTHTLKASRPGYLDTDADDLDNETFILSTTES